jgi:hypothetical protein
MFPAGLMAVLLMAGQAQATLFDQLPYNEPFPTRALPHIEESPMAKYIPSPRDWVRE